MDPNRPPPLSSVWSARLLAMLNCASDGWSGPRSIRAAMRCGDFCGLGEFKLRVAVVELPAQNLLEPPC
jgi:hypothetical protein